MFYRADKHYTFVAKQVHDDLQSDELLLLAKNKTNRLVAQALTQEIGCYKHVLADEHGCYSLHSTFPCYRDDVLVTHTVEYKPVDLFECTHEVSLEAFASLLNSKPNYTLNLLDRIIESISDFKQGYTIFRFNDNPNSFSIIAHGRYRDGYELIKELGSRHYFVFTMNITKIDYNQ